MKNAPKKLSRKKAIELFRDHWNRIAVFFEEMKATGYDGLDTVKLYCLIAQGFYYDALTDDNDCWLCYYSGRDDDYFCNCEKCPIEWPETTLPEKCCGIYSPFRKLERCKSWKKSAELAREIANLPEKK